MKGKRKAYTEAQTQHFFATMRDAKRREHLSRRDKAARDVGIPSLEQLQVIDAESGAAARQGRG